MVFWSSWAPTCTLLLSELPELVEEFRILTVLVDARDPGTESKPAGELDVLVPASETIPDHYGVELLPTVVVLDGGGRARDRLEGYHPGIIEELRQLVRED